MNSKANNTASSQSKKNIESTTAYSYGDMAAEYFFKIVLVGDSGVGKSNLLLRYTKNEFVENSSITVGIEFMSKILKIDSDQQYVKA